MPGERTPIVSIQQAFGLLAILQGHTGTVNSAVFAPDGGRILTASSDNTARLWDRDGKALGTLEGHTNWIRSAAFSPDGGRILTLSLIHI